MAKRRREAFSEGVIAIVVTLMVLEMKLPRRDTAQTLGPVLPDVPSYILSFGYVGIYWKNHLDMLHAYTPETRSIIYSVSRIRGTFQSYSARRFSIRRSRISQGSPPDRRSGNAPTPCEAPSDTSMISW